MKKGYSIQFTSKRDKSITMTILVYSCTKILKKKEKKVERNSCVVRLWES